MKVFRREQRGTEILGLAGRLTAGHGVEILRGLEKALLDGADRHLILDLARIDYIDAAGVGELLHLRRRAMKSGVNLVLSGLSNRVLSVLGVARLADELNIAADVDTALERLASAPGDGPETTSRRSRHGKRRSSARVRHIPVTVAL